MDMEMDDGEDGYVFDIEKKIQEENMQEKLMEDYMNLDGDSSSEDPVYKEITEAMKKGNFVSRGKSKGDKFKGIINQHDMVEYRVNKALNVSKVVFDMTDKRYLNDYQKLILSKALMFGINGVRCDYTGRIDLIISKCLMEIEADPDDEEEKLLVMLIMSGMLTRGKQGGSRQIKKKHLYEHIEDICSDVGTKGYRGGRIEELMDGIIQVWCENIANYNYDGEYDYVCYERVIYDNEAALSAHLGETRKVPSHGIGGRGHIGNTWDQWYSFYGPSGKGYLLQWVAQEFERAKDPAPFPRDF
jgi:hypothetical protein